MSWLLAFLGFAALIVLHEFGHFAAAKAVGMRVEKFSLFFGPMLLKFRRGETSYGIAAIPLGGYVKISGMNPHEELPPAVQHRAYYRQKTWKRIVVILAGPAMNLLIAFVIFFCLFVFKGPAVQQPVIDTVSPKTAAALVLRPDDRVIAVDGVRGDPDTLRKQITTHRCAGAQVDGCRAATPVRITLVRNGSTRTVTAYPRYSTADPDNPRPLLGFVFRFRNEREGALDAAKESVTGMWHVTTATVSAIGRIFVSEKARKQVSGVVGSYERTRQTFKQADYVLALQLLALISLSLAVVNLFPFLPLDGGHVFWAVAEKVRGRPIPFSVLERAGVIGFMLIIALFLIGAFNDVDRLRGAGFGGP
jgi:regulator of sigma E protease